MKPIEVTYFTRKPFPGQVSIERVFQTVSKAMPADVWPRFFVLPRSSTGLRNATANILASRSRQSNVNHITGDIHYVAAGLDPKRTVLTIHDFVSLHRLTGLKRAVFHYLWYVLPARRSAAITVPSGWTVQELRRWMPNCRKPIHVVPNPIPAGFEPDPRPFPGGRPRILHLGTKPNKNLERTVEALSGIDCMLTIVGRLNDAQKQQLAESSLTVENRCDLSDAELVEEYRRCDLVMFASTYEGFGMPILEAQAMGRPIVTSDLLPMKEVSNQAAVLVDPYDAASIRRGVQRLLSDSGLRDEIVQRGFDNAAHYRADRIASDYLSIYENVLERAA